MDEIEAVRQELEYDWMQHAKTVEIDGSPVSYVELGERGKPVLLFVHGIMGSWQHWVLNMRHYADRFHVIALDMPGFGESEMPREPLDMQLYARNVKTFCESLNLSEVTLVGNSMGGLVGAMVVKATPGVIKRLVLVDAAGFSPAYGWIRHLRPFAKLIDPILRLVHRFRVGLNRRRRLMTSLIFWAVASPSKVLPDLTLILLTGLGRRGFVPAAHSLLRLKIDRLPGDLDCPTLIVWGRNDYFLPKKDAFKYMRIAPNSEVKIIADAAHLPMLEQPEKFNAILDEFVAHPISQTDAMPAAETLAA